MRLYRIQQPNGSVADACSEDGTHFERCQGRFPNITSTGEKLELAKLLAPIQPPAIYCIGLNYQKHAAEVGMDLPAHPVLFMKAPSALTGPNDPVLLPRKLRSDKVDYEVELVIVIGKASKNIPETAAMDHVYGYTIANDVSARDWQKHAGSGQWIRGKTFDTFCPLGPCIVSAETLGDPHQLGLRTWVNDELRQDANTNDFIFTIPQLIAYLSSDTTLQPGTLILTGTPSGVGMAMQPRQFLKPGDRVTCEIDGIGRLVNPVLEADT